MGKLREKPQFETTHPDFEQYALDFSTPEPELLVRLSRETHFASTVPSMLSGNLQGLLLKMISRMIQPETILEIGTFTVYSAICLAQGLKPGGELITVDNNPESAEIAGKFFNEAGLSHSIRQLTDNALDVLPQLPGPFDLVFIDADKENYLNYYKLVFPKVRQGGIVIADNVFWYGKVFNPDASRDKETQGIARFNEFIRLQNDIEHLLLPVRDGLMIIRKN